MPTISWQLDLKFTVCLVLMMMSCPSAVLAEDAPGYCDGCFCIPAAGESCPTELEPNTNFTSFVDHLLAFDLANPITLNCDPYTANETSCDTSPPLTTGGACVLYFVDDRSEIEDGTEPSCPSDYTYSMGTYAGTAAQAAAAGLYVTHAGACGTCSTLQDLHVYLSRGDGLRDAATSCGIRGLLNQEDGIACYRELGFTEPCATIWHYGTLNTQNFCLDLCLDMVNTGASINGPAPACALHPCIECDEVNSGPLFLKYSGRTRRNSGLLSSIARTCAELVALPQTDPCEYILAEMDYTPVDTDSPTASPASGADVSVQTTSLAFLHGMMWCLLFCGISLYPYY